MIQFNRTVKIGNRTIGADHPTFVIAEIGSNHDGDLDEAMRYVRTAKEAGVDAVKFQSFSADGLVSPRRPISNDPANGWEPNPVHAIIEKVTLPDAWHRPLRDECERLGLEFMSAPFEIGKARMLRELGTRCLKIASGELTNLTLLREVGGYGLPLVISTGYATMAEVDRALETVGRAGCRDVVLLHCVSHYPPRWHEMNVRAVKTLGRTFGCPVGISDHTPGWTAPMLSLALGGRCVEKHVTFERTRTGPDHPYALEWPEFAAMVRELRHGEAALGTGIKSPEDRADAFHGRKSLYSARDLAVGEVITPENTKLVRPMAGIPAEEAGFAYGLTLRKARAAHEALVWSDLKQA